MKKFFFFAMGAIAMMLCSCSGPSSFVKAVDGGTWSTIMVREELTFDQAFNEALDVVAKRFEMDMISKESGYARSNWIYTWNTKGTYTAKYRTRVIFKFSADRKRIDIKTEAEYGGEPNWIKGYDTRLLSTIKQDISGVVGRVVL